MPRVRVITTPTPRLKGAYVGKRYFRRGRHEYEVDAETLEGLRADTEHFSEIEEIAPAPEPLPMKKVPKKKTTTSSETPQESPGEE